MGPTIIAFGHRRRVGKGEAGRFLVEKYGAFQFSFASRLKRVANEMFGWAGLEGEAYYEDHPEKKEIVLQALGKTPREVMIDLGMWARGVHPNTWINATLATLPPKLCVCTDLRFPNEARAVLELGGRIVRIDRPSEAQFDDPADSALADWKEWSAYVLNNGTIEAYREHLNALMQNWAIGQ